MEKERFDDVLGEGMPEYHGWWLRFVDGNRCIHGVAYDDELEMFGSVKITNRGVWGANDVEDWSEDDFGPIPQDDSLFDFALRTIKLEFGATTARIIWAEPEEVEIAL